MKSFVDVGAFRKEFKKRKKKRHSVVGFVFLDHLVNTGACIAFPVCLLVIPSGAEEASNHLRGNRSQPFWNDSPKPNDRTITVSPSILFGMTPATFDRVQLA